ncbi:hypothetical protein F3Y22_tig00116959pilonHSYRG00043 [Hibiscus syriacus]|uniref:S-protein homolog n=1 Tax=Hibiscus syriacus TaxID=106335 RepID=A0A6A2WJY7_HIBSY|nr:S-protein homolog 2-like [Hibiscus syriacus]KAE8659942.1 hypothetical protein F3Y22_tig00116959pilonHSYRG00043 [Hibiscus syriacus]
MNQWANRLVWSLSVMLVLAAGTEAFWNGNVQVRIYNSLEYTKDLTIHCKSKDDDLGARVLSSGEHFEFQFAPHMFKKTLFFCSMAWDGQSHWFDIYEEDRDGDCNSSRCTWDVKQNGPCTVATGTLLFVCHPWNK